MTRRRARSLFAALLLTAACGREPVPGPDVIAQLGNRPMRYVEFQEYLEMNGGDDAAAMDSLALSGLLDQALDSELLRRLAVARELVSDAASRREAVRALIQSTGPLVREKEIAAYYEGHPEAFQRPERVHLRQILVEDRATAERALDALTGGADFAEVARRLSVDPSAPYGGDQGILSREDLPPAFVESIFSLQPGEHGDIVSAPYGFHIFQVVERWPAARLPLEEATPEIRRMLRRTAVETRLRELVEAARDRYNVVVFARNLPFRYQGQYETR